MRKIGTITLAVALIFFGVVLMIRQVSPELGYNIFKFWPSVFILLGGEILFYLNKYGREEKVRFNFFVILVVILFLISEGAFAFGDYVKNNNFNFNFENWDIISNGTKIDKKAEFNKEKNILIFKGNNVNLEIKKTSENKIILDSTLSVNKGDENKNFDITQKVDEDSQIIDLSGNDIKRVEGTLYIPENMALSLDVDNGKVKGEDDFKTNDLKVNGDNASYVLKGFKSVNIENDNGAMNITDCTSVVIKTDNGKATLSGKVENVDITSSNGLVDINNEVCKNIKVSTGNGLIKLRTQNNNFKLSASTDTGVISVNEENKKSKNINEAYGNGEGTVNLKTEVGAIKVNF